MNQQQIDRYIRLIRSEAAPAMECTEPAAGAPSAPTVPCCCCAGRCSAWGGG